MRGLFYRFKQNQSPYFTVDLIGALASGALFHKKKYEQGYVDEEGRPYEGKFPNITEVFFFFIHPWLLLNMRLFQINLRCIMG